MRGKLCAALAAVFLFATPALAGWRLTWQPSGAISLKVVKVKVKVPKEDRYTDVEVLVGIVNPTTGEGRSGSLELRLSGVVVKQFVKPPYYFELPVEQAIYPDKDLLGKIEGQENVAPILLNDGLDHVFEAWFTVRDSKGRIVRGKQASPTVSFRLDPLAVDPAQLAAAIEQRFNQTIEALKQQMQQQKKDYDEVVARLEAEKKAQQERKPPKAAVRVLRNGRLLAQGEQIVVIHPVELTFEFAPSVKAVRLVGSFEDEVFFEQRYTKLEKLCLKSATGGKGGLAPLDPGDPPYDLRIETEDESGNKESISFAVYVFQSKKGDG
ncbi:MAG: hypothetical protein WAP74_00630 [Patescibacteria group bacterium]